MMPSTMDQFSSVYAVKLKKNVKLEVHKDSTDFNEELMDPLKQNNYYVCQNCHQIMSKNKTMPKISM